MILCVKYAKYYRSVNSCIIKAVLGGVRRFLNSMGFNYEFQQNI